MYGCNAAMQLRNGSIVIDGDDSFASESSEYVDGYSDGLCSYDEHITLWHVSVDG